MEVIMATAALMCLATLLFWLRRTDPRLPPFPRKPLPLVGNLFHLEHNSRLQFKAWRKQCGDIFSVNIVGTLLVVLNGFDVMKEAFVKKADAFSDRTQIMSNEATGLSVTGVTFSSGHNWKEQRSVSLAILKKFGMGKNILAEKIQEEVSAYMNYLAGMKGDPIDIRSMTTIVASNIICSIIIGHRFEYDDKEFQKIAAYSNSTGSDQRHVSLINYIPWIKYLPGDVFNAKKLTRNVQAVLNLLNTFIIEKVHNNQESGDAEHFIHAYIEEKQKKLKAGVPTYMDNENLIKILHDLFGAGSETTSTTIYWFVLYMLNFPDIQEKVYQEMKEVVGTDRRPDMQDRAHMPYLNAAILETQRLASIVPLSLMHMCSEDVTLRGYVIPKGTFIIPNLDSVLHDKTIWGEDAMSFRPERFLDTSGNLQDREELISFGIGRRACLGKALAKMELFLLVVNLLQRFQFLPKDKEPPSCNDYIFGITCAPRSYEVRMVERT